MVDRSPTPMRCVAAAAARTATSATIAAALGAMGIGMVLAALPLSAAAQSAAAQAVATQPAVAARPAGGYSGYGGTRWSTDYGIGAGRCDRDAIIVTANGAGQTLVQRHEENLKNRSVGIIGASAGTGLLLSTRLGGRLDERDRRCLGHVLELGSVGRSVGWSNAATRQTYAVAVTEYTPSTAVPSGARPGSRDRCRVLLLTTLATGALGRGNTETLIACQANPGVWSLR